MRTGLKVLDPDFCRDCPHKRIETVYLAGGRVVHYDQCGRRDCDNFEGEAVAVEDVDGAAAIDVTL